MFFLKFLHINVRSIISIDKWNIFKALINDRNPDIILVNEWKSNERKKCTWKDFKNAHPLYYFHTENSSTGIFYKKYFEYFKNKDKFH